MCVWMLCDVWLEQDSPHGPRSPLTMVHTSGEEPTTRGWPVDPAPTTRSFAGKWQGRVAKSKDVNAGLDTRQTGDNAHLPHLGGAIRTQRSATAPRQKLQIERAATAIRPNLQMNSNEANTQTYTRATNRELS